MSTAAHERRLATAQARSRAVRRVLALTFVLNLAVAGAKIAYGYWASSLGIRADGFHSLTDSTNNIIGFVGMALAARPADHDHPYGHEKLEAVAATLIGLTLLALAVDVVHGALQRLLSSDAAVPHLGLGAFAVLGVTLIVNLFVASYERSAGRRLHSPLLESDAAHTRSDAYVTLGVMAAVVGVSQGWIWLDAAVAVLVAGFIGVAGIAVLRNNLGYLADSARVDPERIAEAAASVPGVASVHKIRTRGTPAAVFVDLHVQIAPHLDVVQAHRVTHWVIDAIHDAVPEVQDVLVHTEPAPSGASYAPLPED
ncbi:MAG: cation diffusion facilitator family transporter [Polyangiaceae bacterium]